MAESNQFEAQVMLQFENLDKLSKELEQAISGATKEAYESMSKKMVKDIDGYKKRWKEIQELISKASSRADFEKAQNAMGVLAGHAGRVSSAMQRTNGVGVLNAGKVKAAARGMQELAKANERAARGAIKTSLASQNVVRIIQDAPFGMFGIANNIEQMAESIARLKVQTGSLGGAMKATFLPLVTGPMALPFIISIITALTLSWDKLGGMIDKAKVALGQMTKAQMEFNEAKREFEKNGVKGFVDDVDPEKLAANYESVMERQDQLVNTVVFLNEEFVKRTGHTIQFAQESSDKIEKSANSWTAVITPAMKEAAEALKQEKKLVEEIRLTGQLLEDSVDAADGLKTRMKLGEMKGSKKDHLGFLADEEDEKKKKAKGKRIRTLEEAINAMEVEMMEEGLAKQIAQIKIAGKKERAQLTHEFGAKSELIAMSIEKEAALIRQAEEKHRETSITEMEKTIKKERQAELQRRREKEQRMRGEIALNTQITMFGIQAQAQKIASQVGDMDDPFEAQITEAFMVGDAGLQEIWAERDQITAMMDAGLMDEELANAQLKKLKNEEIAIREDTARRVKEIEEDKKKAILQTSQQTLGAMGDLFGNLNILTAKEGEKGLEENKKFLFAQAAMEAIASGISAYQSIMAMKGIPFPLKVVAAGAQMAAITTRLMASARQIKQIGKNGGATGVTGVTGSFVQLNNSVAGERVYNAAQQRQRDTVLAGADQLSGAINDLSSNVAGSKNQPLNVTVTLSDRMNAGIVTSGSEFNQRHTGTITGSQVGN